MDKYRNIEIMGIVNLTDDSFYAQSRCANVQDALSRVSDLVDEGADIVDFGACSTRPGAEPVGVEQEWSRLEPVLSAVREEFPEITISVDTWWSEIVSRTYDLIGDFIVNDISAGGDDPMMLPVVGELGLKYVAMHKRGTSKTMQSLTRYNDIIGDLVGYFESFAEKAFRFKVKDWILDPGFGFAKTVGQNYELLSRLEELKVLQRPLLVGVSRKSMVYNTLDISPEESLPATQVLHLKALQMGADILRVHDVAEAFRTVDLYRLLG